MVHKTTKIIDVYLFSVNFNFQQEAEQKARVDKIIQELYQIKSSDSYLQSKVKRKPPKPHWRTGDSTLRTMYGDRRHFLYEHSDESMESFCKLASYPQEVRQFLGYDLYSKKENQVRDLYIPRKSRKEKAYNELKKNLKHLY